MLKHQKDALRLRLQKRAERAERLERQTALRHQARTLSERLADGLKAKRETQSGLTAELTIAIEVLLLQGKSVRTVARDLRVALAEVEAILARLAIAAAKRRIDYIARRLAPAAPDPLPRLGDVAKPSTATRDHRRGAR